MKTMTANNRTATVSMPTVQKMEGRIAACENSIERSMEGIAYRAENYYNCIDDYSSGGICDKAANENISACRMEIDLLKEQIKLGRPRVQDFVHFVLADLEGNIVSNRIVDGRFGRCWIIEKDHGNVEFVGLAKRAGTYEKKGYKVVRVEETVEYAYTAEGRTMGGNMKADARLVDRKTTDATKEDLQKWISDQRPYVAFVAAKNAGLV